MTPEQFVCAECSVNLEYAGHMGDMKFYRCPKCKQMWPEYRLPTNLKVYMERTEVKAWLAKRNGDNAIHS